MVVAWLSGSVFNVVTLHCDWLVLGWVTVYGWVNHLGI